MTAATIFTLDELKRMLVTFENIRSTNGFEISNQEKREHLNLVQTHAAVLARAEPAHIDIVSHYHFAEEVSLHGQYLAKYLRKAALFAAADNCENLAIDAMTTARAVHRQLPPKPPKDTPPHPGRIRERRMGDEIPDEPKNKDYMKLRDKGHGR